MITKDGAYGQWRLLSLVAVGGVRQPFATPIDPAVSDDVKRDAGNDQVWLITTQGRELANAPVNVNGAATADPSLPELGAAIPAGQVVLNQSQYRLRLDITGRYGSQRHIIDANSPPFEVTGRGITATLLVPATHIQIVTGVEQLTFPAGTVIDSLVGISLARIEQSSGKRRAVLTEHLTAALNVQATIQVPPKAGDVTIYQTGAGIASPSWQMYWGDVATGVVAGNLPFIAGGLRRTEQLSIPPNVTLLETDNDPLNARAWTLVWSIYP